MTVLPNAQHPEGRSEPAPQGDNDVTSEMVMVLDFDLVRRVDWRRNTLN